MSGWTVANEVAWESVGEELVALRLEDGRYFELNETAAMIFRLMAGGCEGEEIIELLCGEYEIEEDVASNDLETLTASLIENGLISPSG